MGEYTPIRSLKPGMKDMTLMFIVLDVGRPNTTKESHEVRTVSVADKTGSVNVSLWDEPGKHVQSGDIIRMTKGYTSIWKACLTLYVGKGGEFTKVGEFCLVFSEVPFLSEPNPEFAAIAASNHADRDRSGGGGGGGGGGGMDGGGSRKPFNRANNGGPIGSNTPPVGSLAGSTNLEGAGAPRARFSANGVGPPAVGLGTSNMPWNPNVAPPGLARNAMGLSSVRSNVKR